MSSTREEVAEYMKEYQTANKDHRDILRTMALLKFWKWEEIKNRIRAIDFEEAV